MDRVLDVPRAPQAFVQLVLWNFETIQGGRKDIYCSCSHLYTIILACQTALILNGAIRKASWFSLKYYWYRRRKTEGGVSELSGLLAKLG